MTESDGAYCACAARPALLQTRTWCGAGAVILCWVKSRPALSTTRGPLVRVVLMAVVRDLNCPTRMEGAPQAAALKRCLLPCTRKQTV